MFQIIALAVIILLTVIDRITKIAVCKTIMVDGPKEFFGGLFQLRYVENTGAAFSAFSDSTVVLTVFTILIIILCLYLIFSKRIKKMFPNICLILVVAGGIGNEIDRIMNGFVVDFIEPLFMDFAVFNFADCCITVGAILLMAYEIKELIAEKKEAKATADNNESKKDDCENH